MVAKTRAEKDANLKKFLAKFPNNAKSWSQATDEVVDLNRLLCEYLEDDSYCTYTFNGGKVPLIVRASPSARNTFYKKTILANVKKLNDHNHKLFYEHYLHWFEPESEMAKGGGVRTSQKTITFKGIKFKNSYGISEEDFNDAIEGYYLTGGDQVDRITGRMKLNRLESKLKDSGLWGKVMDYVVNKFSDHGIFKKGGNIFYKGLPIHKEHPSGMYTFFSDKRKRFIKSDDLTNLKKQIDKEGQMAKGGSVGGFNYSIGGL